MTLFTILLIVIVILAVIGLGWNSFAVGVLDGFDRVLDVGLPIIKNLTQEAQAQEATEQCAVGLSILKGLIDDGTEDQDVIDMYNNGLREDELKLYIDENIDELAIPDWMKDSDSDSALCLVAKGVVEQERLQGTTFMGADLDDAITLQALNTQGEAAARVLENGQ